MRLRLAAILLIAIPAAAQIQMQDSHTTAGLRGIFNVDGKIAWASGTNGTILRTTDGGTTWTKCAIADTDKLDFRGILAWDSKEALVMSSGPGEASRIFRTRDGCATWTELARSHTKEGFWDAIAFPKFGPGILVGDPINGHFETQWISRDRSRLAPENVCVAEEGEGAFAASNTSAIAFATGDALIGTGGKSGARVLQWSAPCLDNCPAKCEGVSVPISFGDSSGIFSLAQRDATHIVAVGGDYKKPNDSTGTAAFSSDGGHTWTAAKTPPHGYRSAVAWDKQSQLWIAVGTNGSDISRDDGLTWQPLENGNWNAISPPFVVGPNGRIGKLEVPPSR
ncbi:MAG TPA: hypothetical protein VGL89_17125 [Candidatus Koribacter sp.]|jgi:photosystem II stability/assembly factor-like uncharacterized protein